jgi:hypothetical protein
MRRVVRCSAGQGVLWEVPGWAPMTGQLFGIYWVSHPPSLELLEWLSDSQVACPNCVFTGFTLVRQTVLPLENWMWIFQVSGSMVYVNDYAHETHLIECGQDGFNNAFFRGLQLPNELDCNIQKDRAI